MSAWLAAIRSDPRQFRYMTGFEFKALAYGDGYMKSVEIRVEGPADGTTENYPDHRFTS